MEPLLDRSLFYAPVPKAVRRRSRGVLTTSAVLFSATTVTFGLLFVLANPNHSITAFRSLVAGPIERLQIPVERAVAAAGSGVAALDSAADAMYRWLCPYLRTCAIETSAKARTLPTAPRTLSAVAATSTPIAQPLPTYTPPLQQTTINQPVIERIIEREVALAPDTSAFTIALRQLESSLSQRLALVAASIPSTQHFVSAPTFAHSQKIDNLSNVSITNPTITGGSIAASSISGTIANAIESAVATITSLTATEVTFTRATTTDLVATSATTTTFAVTGSATSTFGGGLSTTRFNATATSTLSGLVLDGRGLRFTTLDCSSFVNGGTLTTDASGNVICAADDGGSGGSVGGSNTQVQFNNSGSFAGDSGFTYASSSDLLTVTNASTTAFTAGYASTTNLVASNSFTFRNVTGFLKATAGAVATALIDLASDVTSILPVANGGTGWTSLATNTLLTGNGSGALATTTVGNGLSLSAGVLSTSFSTTTANTWTALQAFVAGASSTRFSIFGTAYFGGTATTTIDSGGNLAVAGTLNVTGDATLANATSTNFAVAGTASTSALVASNSFTFRNVTGFLKATAGTVATALVNLASDVSGILPVGSGGTGWGSFASGAIPYGNASSALATSSSLTFDGTKLTVAYASSTALTVSGTAYFGTATTSFLHGANLSTCDGGSFLTWSGGLFGCGSGGGGGGVSLSDQNTWTALQIFSAGASTTLLSISNGSATTTISGHATSTFGGGVSVTGNINFTGKLLEDGNEVFSGVIAPFASSCPTGWTEYTAARGRTVVGTPSAGTNTGTVGSALSNLGSRTVTDVPSHLHTVDPPSTATDSQGAHTHSAAVVSGITSAPTDSGNNFAQSGSTGSAGAHTHNVDIAAFNSGSTGVASVDVTMPYIQLTYCQKTAGADLAEWIPASEKIERATIVSADPNNREKVIASRTEYDSSVVGIVATQPGWLIGQEEKGSVQMALAGRVPLRVTLKSGEIRPGDPITTSGIPGVGMRATRAGPIVGKALEAVNETSSLTGCTDPATGKVEQCAEALVFVNISWYAPGAEGTNDTVATPASTYWEPLSVGSDFEDGDIAALSYAFAQKAGNALAVEKVGYLMPARSDNWTGVVSRQIGGPGELLRRTRVNNRITDELRLVTSGKAEVKISSLSAPIKIGDPIAVAHDHAGTGAHAGGGERAHEAGFIIGRAMEEWEPSSGKKTIAVMLGSSWYVPPPELSGRHDHNDEADGLFGYFSGQGHHAHGHEGLGIFRHLTAHLIEWFADAANGIVTFFADNIHARNRLCIGSTCVTEVQLQALLAGQTASATQSQHGGNTPAGAPDTTPPVIAILGNNPAIIHVGDAYSDLGATVTDNVDSNLGYQTFLGSTPWASLYLDTSEPSQWRIHYVATDTAGNTATSTRTVIVEGPSIGPEPEQEQASTP